MIFRAKLKGTKLERAVREKLEAQAEFVFWWDTKGPGLDHGAGGGNKKGNRSVTFLDVNDWKMIISRWRKKLNENYPVNSGYRIQALLSGSRGPSAQAQPEKSP